MPRRNELRRMGEPLVRFGRDGIQRRSAEEEDAPLVVSVELLADISRDCRVGCIAELINLYWTRSIRVVGVRRYNGGSRSRLRLTASWIP